MCLLNNPTYLLCVCFVDRCLSFCTFVFFWSLCNLFFFDIRIIITPLVSSNSSHQTELLSLIYVYLLNMIQTCLIRDLRELSTEDWTQISWSYFDSGMLLALQFLRICLIFTLDKNIIKNK
jgi:hypothetical protein